MQQILLTKLNWISQPFCILSLALSKISVALLILRIIPLHLRTQRILLIMAMVGTVSLAGFDCFVIFVQCIPMEALWNPLNTEGAKCWRIKTVTVIAICTGCRYWSCAVVGPG